MTGQLARRARAAIDAGATVPDKWRPLRAMIPPAGPALDRADDARIATAIEARFSPGGRDAARAMLARFVDTLEQSL